MLKLLSNNFSNIPQNSNHLSSSLVSVYMSLMAIIYLFSLSYLPLAMLQVSFVTMMNVNTVCLLLQMSYKCENSVRNILIGKPFKKNVHILPFARFGIQLYKLKGLYYILYIYCLVLFACYCMCVLLYIWFSACHLNSILTRLDLLLCWSRG